MKPFLVALATLLICSPLLAQSSPSFSLQEHTLNSGGSPANGAVASSSSFKISADSIGDPFAMTHSESTSYTLDGGFITAYPPPSEVIGVHLPEKGKLEWAPEASAGTYCVYRGLLGQMAEGYGACLASELEDESALVPADPNVGQCYFYIVTARNRLGEEGTMGCGSGGQERQPDTGCP